MTPLPPLFHRIIVKSSLAKAVHPHLVEVLVMYVGEIVSVLWTVIVTPGPPTLPPLVLTIKVVVIALTGVVLVVGVVIVLNDLVGNPALTDLSETHFSVISRRIRTIPFHKLKIPFVVLQVYWSDLIVFLFGVCVWFFSCVPGLCVC